jgi:hypothetical protein
MDQSQTALAPARTAQHRETSASAQPLPPAWRAFVHYCEQLSHGEIQVLKIQDGLPVMAEMAIKKIKFGM